ncbi:hypothetical protein DL98DRAFT_536557 [Cadophora sp. DSE1049]|nr:hypothetical protein DL98DRAFT_536557 [Cadophora sp. DSE1049]
MDSKPQQKSNQRFSTPRLSTSNDEFQGPHSYLPSLSVNGTVDLPLRPNNGAASAEAATRKDKIVAEVDQQLNDTMAVVSSPIRSFGIGCKSTIAPGREMFMYAKSTQLIKDIQDRGYTTVRMTCGTLEKVFGYIGHLQKQNDFLKAKLTNGLSNRQSIVTLRPPPLGLPAKTFTLFPKLPLEVRLIIWKLALYNPRTISVDTIIPRPLLSPIYTQPLTNLRFVCHESRAEALKVQIALNKVSVGDKTIFISPSVDVLWLSAWGISDDEWILVFKILHKTLAHNRLPKIAVNLELWDRLMSGNNTRSRFLDAVAAFRTEEIVIVMGGLSAFGSPDLILRDPRGKPRAVLHTNFISRFRQLPANVTWDELNQTLLMEITNNKLLRFEVRQRMREAGLNPDHANYRGRFNEVSHWGFRSVHFMEATTYATMKRQ